MTGGRDSPFDDGRARPVPTVLDTLRARIDHDAFDAAVFALESVVADLGFGDVRALPGSVAWIDRLREEGKRTAVLFAGDSADAALELAGIADRFDEVVSGPRAPGTLDRALAALAVAHERAVFVDVAPSGLAAANEVGMYAAIAVARSAASPAELRQSGAAVVVADLQELLG